MSEQLPRRIRQAILALVLGTSLPHCSYDIVYSNSSAVGLAGSAGAPGDGNGAAATGGSAGSSSWNAVTVGGSAGATPSVALTPGIPWQWQLTATLDTAVAADLFIVDLEDEGLPDLTRTGRTSICNFSAGTSELWRADVTNLPPEIVGNAMSGHSNELWLDIRTASVRALMTARLDRAVTRGCTGVLPDSVDGYGANTGFGLAQADYLDYLSFLSGEARKRALLIGLSNAPELVSMAEAWFDFELSVNCLEYDECQQYQPFVVAHKPVLHAEVVNDVIVGEQRLASVCSDSRRAGFSTIIKTSELDAWRLSCD